MGPLQDHLLARVKQKTQNTSTRREEQKGHEMLILITAGFGSHIYTNKHNAHSKCKHDRILLLRFFFFIHFFLKYRK